MPEPLPSTTPTPTSAAAVPPHSPRRADARPSVLVCRGCCCGTIAKHPGIDHAGHVARLTAAVAEVRGAKLWTVDCLDACDHSNVVVVRTGGVKRWLGGMLDDTDVDSLAEWLRTEPRGELPASLQAHVFDPEEAPPIAIEMAPLRGAELVAWITSALAAGGGWSIGVQGAVGEFDPDGATVSTRGTEIVARTSTGAMRITVADDTRAFFVGRADPTGEPVLVVLASVAAPGHVRRRVAVIGPDVDAIDAVHRTDTLVDLGIGRSAAQFTVRTSDPSLLELIAGVVGLDWRTALERIGPRLVAAAPHRVITSPLGRVEVSSPIPAPGTESPDGAHTHLLPGDLERDEDLPFGIRLPKGFTPGAVHFHRRTAPVAG